jgi:hypothetical protein
MSHQSMRNMSASANLSSMSSCISDLICSSTSACRPGVSRACVLSCSLTSASAGSTSASTPTSASASTSDASASTLTFVLASFACVFFHVGVFGVFALFDGVSSSSAGVYCSSPVSLSACMSASCRSSRHSDSYLQASCACETESPCCWSELRQQKWKRHQASS